MKIRITNKKVPKAEFGIPGPPKPFDYQGGMKKLLGTFDGMTQPSYGYKPMGLPERPAYQQQELKFDPKPGMNKILGTFDPYVPLFSGAPATKSKIGYTPKGLPSRESITGTGVEQPKYDPWREDLASGIFAFKGMLTGANALTDFFSDQRQQRNFNRAMVEDRLGARAMAPTSGSRGDYMVNEGLFRPDDTYVPNKGMYTNQFYPGFRTMQIGGGVLPEELSMPLDYISTPVENYDTGSTGASESASSSSAVLGENMALPLDPYKFRVTSGFGQRKAPKAGASTDHGGVDLGAEEGSNIYSIKPGKVVSVYTNDQGGRQVVIQHADGTRSGYAHLKDWAIKEGDEVNAGDVIGYVGSTGVATGPHLHFTYRDAQGNKIDPMNYIDFNQYSSNAKGQGKGGQQPEMSYRHNNPLNIHYGEFAQQYGGIKGDPDAGGHVAKFSSFDVGIQAAKDLLFSGPNYKNLTISQARQRWVGYPNESTANIVKAMGKDVKLSELTDAERDKLVKEFAKWEGRQAYNQIKDRKLFAFGGMHDDQFTNSDTMKIRITREPSTENIEQMAYGGQMGYGLDLNRRKVYTDMPESMADTYSNSITEEDNPEEPYVLEAEGGETILRPDGTHFNITGKRHSQGGEKLTGSQAPEGSFIYSDTAKMRLSGPMLKMFGKSEKGKFTPAEIAKQYDVNKYMSVLNDKSSDTLQRETAQKMIENYQRKLSALALMQEAKKGFRDGIPQVAMPYLESIMGAMPQQEGGQEQMPQARYGGYLQKYQDLGQVKTKAQKAAEKKEVEGWTQVGKEGNRTYYEKKTKIKDATQGTPGSSVLVKEGVSGGRAGKAWENFIISQLQNGVTIDELAKKRHGTVEGLQKYKQYYKPVPGTLGTPEEWKVDYRYLEEDPAVTTTPPGTTTSEPPGTDKSEPGPTVGNPGQMGSSNYPSRWMTPDKVNMLASLALPPKKFLPYIPQLNITTPEPVFEDWRAKAAARQAMYNTAGRTMGNYGPTQGLASNLAFMAGQQGDALIQDIAGTETRNVGIANQFSGINAEMMNRAAEYDAKRKQGLYDGNVIANQQYRNAWRDYLNKNARTFGQGWNNASMLAAMNATNENFQIDPRSGRVMFRNTGNPFASGNSPKSGALTQEQYLAAVKTLKDKGLSLSDDQINTALRIQFPQLAAMTGSRSNAASQLAMYQALMNQQQQQ